MDRKHLVVPLLSGFMFLWMWMLVPQKPDITIAARADPLVPPGATVNYLVTLNNAGSKGLSVTITHTLPYSFSYLSGSTEVRAGSSLLSTADPVPSGRNLTWGPFDVPGAAYSADSHFGIHTFVQDLCLESYLDFQLDKALNLVGEGGYVKQLFYPVTGVVTQPKECWVYFVEGAYQRGLKPVIRLQGKLQGNSWLKPEADAPGDYTTVAQAFKRVVEGLPRRDGHTLYVEVWNEPELAVNWHPSPSAQEYGQFFVDVAQAIHSIGDARLKVLNGALTPGNADFTRELVAVPGFVQAFDLWAAHCYPYNHPPQYNIHDGTAAYTEFTIDSYRRELDVLANEGGRTGVKVILTETGHGLGDNLFTFEGYEAITETNRADYMVRAFRDYWAGWPELEAACPFELVDPYGHWGWMDWLYPTTDVPHAQYTAVAALPKPTPTFVASGTLAIAFQARAANEQGIYYSDIVATASNGAISPLSGAAPVIVLDVVSQSYLPVVMKSISPAAAIHPPVLERNVRPSALDFTPLIPALSSAEALRVTRLDVGPGPRRMALDPVARRAYVTRDGGQVVVVDMDKGTVLGAVYVGDDPWGVAVDPAEGRVYVTGAAGLSVIDGARVVAVVPGLDRPRDLAVDAEKRRLYVSESGADRVAVIEGSRVVAAIPVGSHPDGLALDPETGRLYVANVGDGSLSVIEDLAVVNTIQITDKPLLGLALDPVSGCLYVVHPLVPGRHVVTVIDRQGKIVDRLGGGYDRPLRGAYAVAVSPDGSSLYLADRGELLEIEVRKRALVGAVPTGAVVHSSGLAVDPVSGRVYVVDMAH